MDFLLRFQTNILKVGIKLMGTILPYLLSRVPCLQCLFNESTSPPTAHLPSILLHCNLIFSLLLPSTMHSRHFLGTLFFSTLMKWPNHLNLFLPSHPASWMIPNHLLIISFLEICINIRYHLSLDIGCIVWKHTWDSYQWQRYDIVQLDNKYPVVCQRTNIP